MIDEVKLMEIEPQPTVVIREQVARKELAFRLAELIPQVQEYLEQQQIRPGGRPFARVHNFGPVERVNVDLEVGIPVGEPVDVDGEGNIAGARLPGCQAAVTFYKGPYDEIEKAYDALQDWIEANDYEADGTPWESYRTDLSGVADTAGWEVDITWPVKKP